MTTLTLRETLCSPQLMLLVGSIMDSRNKFAALEVMCREKAALAKKEMDYWLAEASEWKRLREASSASELRMPVQLDWCAASES